MKHNIFRNIKHIQIKKVAYTPNLYKAILTFEDTENKDIKKVVSNNKNYNNIFDFDVIKK